MRFRRSLRRWREPPPVLLPSLERLAELIERVVELVDQVAVSPSHEAAPSSPVVPDPEPDAAPDPAPSVDGHLLFVSSPDGYRLLEREGGPPARGELLELEGAEYRVLRLGRSPLPGDRRRCAYLEREEPPKADRNLDR